MKVIRTQGEGVLALLYRDGVDTTGNAVSRTRAAARFGEMCFAWGCRTRRMLAFSEEWVSKKRDKAAALRIALASERDL